MNVHLELSPWLILSQKGVHYHFAMARIRVIQHFCFFKLFQEGMKPVAASQYLQKQLLFAVTWDNFFKTKYFAISQLIKRIIAVPHFISVLP